MAGLPGAGWGLVPLHATPGDQPPPLTPVRLLTEWSMNWWVAVAVVLTGALYLWGVLRMRKRGDRWPLSRTLSFVVGGLGSAVVATMSALGTYDTVLFSVHAAQHMVLMMITPLFCALGAPVTLALRTAPAGVRRALLRVLHSPWARVITFPPFALALFIATPFALYYSSFYPLSLASPFWHTFLHLHFVIVGSLLMWPLVGVDPVPGKARYPLRLLILFLMLPFHAFLGVSMMSSTQLLAGDWYLAFGRTWAPSPLEDQYLAGAIMWGSGDIVAAALLVVLFVQWFLSSQREAVREDRRLDRLEAQLAKEQARYDRTAVSRSDAPADAAPTEPRMTPHD